MVHSPVFDCPKHGPGCDYNLVDHPLPPQGRGALRSRSDDEEFGDDPTGEEADIASKRMYGP